MTQTQEHNVPALRFPEFDGEWKERKLGEVVKIERGRFSPRPRNDPKYYGGEIPFVQTSDVVNSKGRIRAYSQTLNNLGLGVSKLFPKGSLLITIAANIGYAGVLEIDMACPDSLIGLTCSKALNNYFLNYILEIEQPKMDYLAVEAAQKNINIEFLRPYRIDFPKLPEQQKIASFLSQVDRKIAQLGEKKALLQAYKKGMMQKLFSQELRFKDPQGHDFPDWEEKRLGEVVQKVSKSFNPVTSSENWQSVELESLGQGDGRILKTFPVQNLQSIKTKFQKGDVLFGKLRPYLRKYARPEFDGVCTSEIWVLRGKSISNEFLFFLIQSERFNQVANIQSGSKMPRSDWTIVSATVFSFPALSEQQKIADFLSSIDRKIDLVSTELDHAKTFKKGLLQQMFI